MTDQFLLYMVLRGGTLGRLGGLGECAPEVKVKLETEFLNVIYLDSRRDISRIYRSHFEHFTAKVTISQVIVKGSWTVV